MDGRRLGSLVGAVGGLAFVLLSAGELPAAWLWRVLGVVAALAVVACVALLPSDPPPPPDRRGVRLYGWSVVLMVLAIFAGARVLDASGHAGLVRAWVVVAVGLHFLPFARAFSQPLFTRLGVVLAVVGVLGLALSPAYDDAPGAAAVAAGFVLLAAGAAGMLAGRSSGAAGPVSGSR
ncbi:hypothetical protein [Nocardioides litoris]|uniref:hypothetical protein n=1 Tax=Nocardioides litoris TaxID=1926648 RepID=UPI001123E421|nr:hypothetical protein [Nocardioides litoris]